MTLEQIVTDLATSQQLRDKGFPQDTAMQWYPEHCDDYEAEAPASLWPDEWKRIAVGQPVVCVREEMEDHESLCAAPTAGELEEWLFVKGYSVNTAMCWAGYVVSVKNNEEERTGKFSPKHVAALALLALEVTP